MGRGDKTSQLKCVLRVSSQGYDDGYGGEYDDESYEAYEDNYTGQSKRWCLPSHTNKKSFFQSFNTFFQSPSTVSNVTYESDSQPGVLVQ